MPPRTAANSTRGPAAVRSIAEDEPPQSTITAQLIEGHSLVDGRRRPKSRDGFLQLLRETKVHDVERDAQTNYKLLAVLTEAGLDALTAETLLLCQEDVYDQAVAILDVIQTAVQRSPDVLLYAGPGTEGPGSQVCLWLLPRVFALLRRDETGTIGHRLRQLFSGFAISLCQVPALWQELALLVHLYYAFAEELLEGLEGFVCSTTSSVNFCVLLPSVITRSKLVQGVQQPIAIPIGRQTPVRDPTHAARIILTLISSVLEFTSKDSSKHASSTPLMNYRSWILNVLSRLWRCLHDNHGIKESDGRVSGAYLQVLNEFTNTITAFNGCGVIRNRTASLLADCVLYAVMQPLHCFNSTYQQAVALSCSAMVDLISTLHLVRHEVQQKLLTSLKALIDDHKQFQNLSKDLQSVTRRLCDTLKFEGAQQEMFKMSIGSDRHRTKIANHMLDVPSSATQHGLGEAMLNDNNRSSKRRRRDHDLVANSSTNVIFTQLHHELCSLFDWSAENMEALPVVFEKLFEDLLDQQKRRCLQILGELPCAGAYCATSLTGHNTKGNPCTAYSSNGATEAEQRNVFRDEQALNWIFQILMTASNCTEVQVSRELQVLVMNAVRSLSNHTSTTSQLDFDSSFMAKLCLESLQNSSRELRIMAGRALPNFLRVETNPEHQFRRKNRVIALNQLRHLSATNEPQFVETVILALGQVADVCDEEEMNLVLLLLVDFLGHTNSLVCALAHVELRRIASVLAISLEELLRPFWRTIGITVVKDLHSKPQKTQQLSELLGMSVKEFLILTQTVTVPYLVLWRKQDILKRIAAAQSHDQTVWNLCMKQHNLTAIFSLLIAQQPEDIESTVKDTLIDADSAFRNEDIIALLVLDPIGVACELLKSAGDEEGSAKTKVLEGFRGYTIIVEGQRSRTRNASAAAKIAAAFFGNHALGIMASFSNIIEDPVASFSEKRRCLRGIEEMIALARGSIIVAIPQIRACLQSALSLPDLCDLAFSAWSSLLGVLETDEDLESLIDYTFTAIVQNWTKFSATTQQKAHDTVAALLKGHSALILNAVHSIPSFATIPLMSKFESQLSRVKSQLNANQHLEAFARRCRDENVHVVLQALRELLPFLESHQQWINDLTVIEPPSKAISELYRSLLDSETRFAEIHQEISQLGAQCLGIMGAVDANKMEIVREKHDMILLSNFSEAGEVVEFVAFFLENVLVKAFHSVSNPRAQGFLGYVMQELLKFCGFSKEGLHTYRPQGSQADAIHVRWTKMPESVKNTLTPFLSSHYVLAVHTTKPRAHHSYPLYTPTTSHGSWLRDFVFDLLNKSHGDNAKSIFLLVARIIRGFDLSIASFLLPFAFTNVLLAGTDSDILAISQELLVVLKQPMTGMSQSQTEVTRLCSENVFQVLDYLSQWAQEKKKRFIADRNLAAKSGRTMSEVEEVADNAQIENVEKVLSSFPADVISRRAVECRSFARALFHWEQHMRQQKEGRPQETQAENNEAYYSRLQEIYSQIDEPDGLEGMSAHLQILSPDQQVIEHCRAGRWAAAQSWYEYQLSVRPDSIEFHVELVKCLHAANQYHVVLDHIKTIPTLPQSNHKILSIVSEAAWCAERWNDLDMILRRSPDRLLVNFNAAVGTAVLALRSKQYNDFQAIVSNLRDVVTRTLTASATASLQACHDQLLKLHALYEMEVISRNTSSGQDDTAVIITTLNRRLDILGSHLHDKQYLLGLRRAVMQNARLEFPKEDIAASWMTTAKLARKADFTNLAYDAVLHASALGDESAKIEQARLLWKDGEHRKAIQILEGAIALNAFNASNVDGGSNVASLANHSANSAPNDKQQQNLLVARAHLLLAKWLDRAGQTQSKIINARYQFAQKSFTRWEKGLYYLGKYYNKLLESEKALPPVKQNLTFLSGENSKLVIENYLRSLVFGCKYIFETLPRLLTLWLEFGMEISRAISSDVADDIRRRSLDLRPKHLDTINKHVKKYLDKIPAYMFYTAISQMITRISHPNQKVYDILASIIVKVVAAHPQQALWPLLAVVKSSASDRSSRGVNLLNKLKDRGKNIRNEGQSVDLRSLVTQGQKLSDQLLHVCEVNVESRTTNVSLSKDLGFKQQVAPCPLVVPLQKTLTATLPTTIDPAQMRAHKAFPMSREAITINSFFDDVLILSSLQKPRKVTIRGSDGNRYGLLCKPNDDLRKDQRLMEFNAMINRCLKKDAESSKRRLYIKTYAVTPLNEACGLIEWVDGLKPMRDILLALYRQKNVKVDYQLLRELLNESCANQPDSTRIFTETILPMYPPVLHEWFTELFPQPETWFAARLRYTRSCAVASVVGLVLGLGDRHGENVLLEENSGGVFHVDFNCLFDKGLTFEKPELVPFRLTHNMVDAFGAYGVEGPFRRSAEQAMKVMRGNEDALLTILETFVYDPTADFVGGKKRGHRGVPETPKEVLESVGAKVRGLLRGESVPLSVEGHVDALIRQATAPENLCAMYIGWCAFL